MDAFEGKRRRRKKTGLRVPSDDVPRRAGSEGDPRLALAGAFGDDDAPEDFEDASDAEQPSVGLGQLAGDGDRANTSGDSVDIAFDDEDSEIRVFTSEIADVGNVDDGEVAAMAGVSAAAIGAEDDDIEDVSGEVELLSDGPRTDQVAAVEAPVDATPFDDGRKTELMPAMTEEDVAALAADEPTAEADGSGPLGSAPSPMPSPDDDWDGEAEGEDVVLDTDAALPAIVAAPTDDDDEPEVSVVETVPEDEGSEDEEVVAHASGGRIEPGNAADSGELLTDDLIEEYGAAEAQPAAPASDGAARDVDVRAQTVLEPVEEIAAADMVEVEIGPLPAAAEPPPAPVPAPAAGEPPPAPKAAATPPPPRKRPPPAPPRAALGQAPAPPRRKAKPWFEEIFDEDYLRTLPFLTPRQTQKQAAFVVEALGVDPGASVLDVGCGYGRHAMELAARGYHVVGLDASLPLLIRGADEAQRRGLTINFVHGDMRELTFEHQFDGAYCLFGTFGYFDDETNKKTAQAVARALKPGARFVVEALNRDYLITDLPARVWWEGDGCVVLEEVDFNYFSSRIVSNRSVVFDDGRQLEQEISMRAYSLHELGKLLHAAGFRIVELSGSMDTKGRFFGNKSREILVVCEKRGPKSTGDTAPPTSLGDDELGNGKAGTLPGPGGDNR